MFRRLTFFLVAVILQVSLFAQIPAGYYDNATGKTGDVLRAALRDIISTGHVKLPYTSSSFDVWDAYAVTDVRPSPNNTIIWDMYSDIPSGSPAYTFTIFTDQCGTAAAEGDCYSREHMMPNSWWGGLDDASNPQYTDLHHLMPSDQYVNNRKSNYIIAETNSPSWTSTNGSKIGSCSLSGFSGTVFEPINDYKGDFARALLYLATRYMDVMSTWRNNYTSYDSKYIIATTGGNYLQWYVDMLVRWHNQDPVSQKEIDRNNNIYYNTPQHNRNPYIDHPEYVCLVWTSANCATVPVIINVANTPAFPAPANTVSVSADITDNGSISSAVMQWCTDGTSFGNSITMNLNTAPHYITASSIPAQAAGTTIYYRIIATDNEGNATTSAVYSYTVLKNEPTNHPTGFGCGSTTSSSISLSWVDATGTVIPDGYLIKASTVSAAAITDPVDGIAETDGSFVKNIAAGVQSVSFSGLLAGSTYYFKIYSYTNSASNINYKTSTGVLSSACTTSSGGSGSGCATDLIISEYVEGSGSNKYIELYNNTGAAVNLANYKLRLFANGATSPVQDITLSGTLNDQSVIVYKNASATAYTGTATVCDATNFNGNDAVALYKISTTSYVDIFGRIGENPGTAWISGTFTTLDRTLVRNPNVTSGVTVNPASGFPTLSTEWTKSNTDVVSFLGAHTMSCGTSCAIPTVQSSLLNVSNTGTGSTTIGWTAGNGSSHLLVIRQGSAITGSPVAGTTYTANSVFGLGSLLNSGEYVIYNGSGNSVTVTGLTAGTTYYLSLFEYNCTTGNELYLVPGISSSFTTYALNTGTTANLQYCVTSATGTAMSIDFTSTGSFTSNTYTAQLSGPTGSFATLVNIGTLVSNSNSGTINCSIPANTASGTAYKIRVISSNPAITGSESNAFEIILYSPATTPTQANASRSVFCVDDAGTINLSVSGGSGSSVEWYTASCPGISAGSGNPITVESPAVATTYYARWENSCSASSCVSITLSPLSYVSASVSISPSANPVCEGTSVTFTASPVNGGTTPSWQWKLNGGNAGTGSTYNATFNNGDVITCVMTSSESCVTANPATSNAVTMNVSTSLVPSVSITPSANPVCEGTSVTFTASPVNGGTSPSWQWKLNGSNAGTGSTYIATFNNGDVITCVMTSSESCVTVNPATSNAVTMNVSTSLVPSVSITPSANPVCEGTSVTFTANPVNGGTSPSWQWKLNGGNAGTGSTYNATFNNGDVISCVMTSSASCVTANPATSENDTMHIQSNPVVNLGPDLNLCANQTALLDAGIPDATYIWSDNSHASQFLADTSILPLGASSVSVWVTDSMGCSAGDTLMITFDLCTGTEGLNADLFPSIWPNPFHDLLNISYETSIEEYTFLLLDAGGMVVYRTLLASHKEPHLLSIDVHRLAAGIYVAVLESSNGRVFRKLVKN
jgi:endonuclease I